MKEVTIMLRKDLNINIGKNRRSKEEPMVVVADVKISETGTVEKSDINMVPESKILRAR
jgi:hypothetical protein